MSTRKVDALVAALGSQSGISESQVSRICADINVQVQAFLSRPLEASGYAYLYLDATDLPPGAAASIPGSLKERGLTGVKLVISDDHSGLINAIRRMLQGSCWQRCRVHHRSAEGFAYARNLLQTVP